MTRARWLAVLLLAYVAVDFANPLMPGAVSFDPDDSVEAVRAGQTRAQDAGPSAGAPVVPEIGRVPSPERPLVRIGPISRAPRERLGHRRRTPAPSPPAPRPSSEDH